MGWQTEEQKQFFEHHLASFVRSYEEGTVKYFWSDMLQEWFERWPLSEPPPDMTESEWRTKRMEVSTTQQHPAST